MKRLLDLKGQLPGAIQRHAGQCAILVTRPWVQEESLGYTQHVLQSIGVSAMRFSLPEALAASAEPQVDTVVRGVEFAKRLGCSLVVGLGDEAVINASKAISCFLPERARSIGGIESFAMRLNGADAKAPAKTFQSDPCPLVTIPTSPLGGIEASGAFNLMNWDKEERLYFSRGLRKAPGVVVTDKSIMKYEVEKGLALGVDHLGSALLSLAASMLDYVAQGQKSKNFDALLEAHLPNITTQLQTAADVEERIEVVSQLGYELSSFGEVPFPSQCPHTVIAHVLCNKLPLHYNRTVSCVLGPSLRLWENPVYEDALSKFESLQLTPTLFRSADKLSSQGIPGLENDEVLAPVAGSVCELLDGNVSESEVLSTIKECV